MKTIGGDISPNGVALQMPESIEVDHTSYRTTYGKFVIQPLERGYGTTLGNAIRRVLLASLPGAAVTSIRVDGLVHEFSTIPGVKEDLTEIVMALKGVRLKLLRKQPDKVRLALEGPKVFTARDMQVQSREFEIMNPDHVIAHLNKNAKFVFEFTVRGGRGYLPSEENSERNSPIGTIPIDSIFTPVERVKYIVENTRVGQRTDYEKLIIEIWTDGSITPDDALCEAGKILRDHILLFINFEVGPTEEELEGETDEEFLKIRRLLRKPVDELDLSARAANCLKKAKIRTIADLVSKSDAEMLKFENFGRKSLTELGKILSVHSLHFGFDIEKYLGPQPKRLPS